MANGDCYCSFCGKTSHEVFMLIAGPVVYICDECVVAAQEIITKQRIDKAVHDAARSPGQSTTGGK